MQHSSHTSEVDSVYKELSFAKGRMSPLSYKNRQTAQEGKNRSRDRGQKAEEITGNQARLTTGNQSRNDAGKSCMQRGEEQSVSRSLYT